jgi:hypothetical protein
MFFEIILLERRRAMSLLQLIERHLRLHHEPPSRFGRQVAGDPRFVFDLRRGREPRAATEARIRSYLASKDVIKTYQQKGTGL